MSHDVIGLDLGSSEIRAVVVRMALRGFEVVQLESEPVPIGEDGHSKEEDILQAAGRLMERLNVAHETVHCAMPGEFVSVRQLDLPSSASRRLNQVLKFELDELLPFDIDDSVFDFVKVDQTGDEISIVTATAPTDQVARLIEELGKHGITPREIGVSALSYATGLNRHLGEWNETRAIVDIGHKRTNIAVLDLTIPTVRTILRGGRDLTAKLVEVGGVDFAKAEDYKRQHGLNGKVGEVLKKATRPLVREIQQTLKGHMVSGGQRVARVFLCGGGGLVDGLDLYLADELGIPVERYEPTLGQVQDSITTQEASTYGLAYSLALREGVQKAKRIDLRRDQLLFRGDLEFLKRRISWIAACALTVLLSWIFASFAEYTVFADEVDQKKAALAEKTKNLFAKPIFDYKQIADKLGGERTEEPPIPKKDAFDIVLELSKRIPTSVVHDVDLLEIKPKRVTLRGLVNADLKAEGELNDDGSAIKGDAGTDLSPTDLIKQKLEEFEECFTSIRVGKVTAVGDRRRYQMDIESSCP
ncbi:MAG: pilus assembly protein PilM [Proteobacteria bacterium]|nr:pilus assembly protein PilM [Pseudomonadota bacterium]